MQSAINSLTNAGIRYEDAVALRRISMTLHRWHELECGRIIASYPAFTAYVQTDPRGCALYVGENLTDTNYSNGIAVYK